MFYALEAFAEDIVNEDKLRVAHVRHSVVTDEDNVEDIREVARLDCIVKFFGEYVNLLQNSLLPVREHSTPVRYHLFPHVDECGIGPRKMPCLVQ